VDGAWGNKARKLDGAWGREAMKVDWAWGMKPGRWIGRRGGIAWLSCLPGLTQTFCKYKDS